MPVSFELRNPLGEIDLRSAILPASQGEAAFEWPVAVNDLKGNWKLTATELASGRSVRKLVAVRGRHP